MNGPIYTSNRGGGKPEYPKIIPDNQSENRYHISEMKIQLGIEPLPLAGDKPLGLNMSALTH